MARKWIVLILIIGPLGGCDLLIGHLFDRFPLKGLRSQQEETAAPMPTQPAFDPAHYRTVTDCLNAAARTHAELTVCTRRP